MVAAQYVAIEGIDGCGKSTMCITLQQRLTRLGHLPILLIEPSYTVSGSYARQLAVAGAEPEALHMAFTADRFELARKRTLPLLELAQSKPGNGIVLVQDRSYFSAPAYQRANHDITETIMEQEAIAPRPDRVVLLDVTPQLAWQRQNDRAKARGTDVVDRAHLQVAYARYQEMAAAYDFLIVDASAAPEDIATTIISKLWPEECAGV